MNSDLHILLIDNYDSFTFMLRDYILQCGVRCDVYRNDAVLSDEMIHQYHAIVISPGPCSPAEAGNTMGIIHRFHQTKPILGVCLGHQALGQYFGATLTRAKKPVHGKTSTIWHKNDKLFQGILSPFTATRYHSLILTALPQVLENIAYTADDEVMAIKHCSLPLWGVQFHPESCLTKEGLVLIKNFLLLVTQTC
jgi:anthranilate synthase/aminodeoxychorismate synthase-like glutamine amidotransferase